MTRWSRWRYDTRIRERTSSKSCVTGSSGTCTLSSDNLRSNVDSYVSITEVSEYAKGMPAEMLQSRLYPNLPPDGMNAFCFYPMSKRRDAHATALAERQSAALDAHLAGRCCIARRRARPRTWVLRVAPSRARATCPATRWAASGEEEERGPASRSPGSTRASRATCSTCAGC